MSKENGANNGAEKKGFARFMHWYESYQGKRVVGMVYSIGAAVVIIGALFKIMHFKGAGAVLMVGMITEAILFLIGCLDKPHAEFHWHNVFPQLLEHGTDPALLEEMKSRPKPTLLGGSVGGSTVSALSVTEMAKLKHGIENLSKTAEQLTELSKVATATTQLTSKLNLAESAVDQFVNAGKEMAVNSANFGVVYAKVADQMQNVVAGTNEYENQVLSVAKQLSNLNAIYELQVNAVQKQVDAVKTQMETVQKVNAQYDVLSDSVKQMSALASESLKCQEVYNTNSKLLAQQVADLNKVYGNMLNALV